MRLQLVGIQLQVGKNLGLRNLRLFIRLSGLLCFCCFGCLGAVSRFCHESFGGLRNRGLLLVQVCGVIGKGSCCCASSNALQLSEAVLILLIDRVRGILCIGVRNVRLHIVSCACIPFIEAIFGFAIACTVDLLTSILVLLHVFLVVAILLVGSCIVSCVLLHVIRTSSLTSSSVLTHVLLVVALLVLRFDFLEAPA